MIHVYFIRYALIVLLMGQLCPSSPVIRNAIMCLLITGLRLILLIRWINRKEFQMYQFPIVRFCGEDCQVKVSKYDNFRTALRLVT